MATTAAVTGADTGSAAPGTSRRPAKRQQSFAERLVRKRGPGVLAFVGFIGLWQLLIVIFDPSPILFPGPAEVAQEWIDAAASGAMWKATADSMYAMSIGLIISLVIGIPLGLWIGMSPTADLITSPYMWGFFAMPRIALAPLMVMWLGFGASKLQIFGRVIAPNTLPFIASGVRNGISRGFVGLLVIELTVGTGGIGTEVIRSMRDLNTDRMFAFTATLIALALVLVSLSRRLENYASRWREEVVL
jgi:ABC-type nitrate/sulfonate/bicarbonate transport system permease component